MKHVYRFLFILHLIVGIGAFFGGGLTILNPQEPLGMSTEALKYSPFQDYFIPGILLFAVIGLGNLISDFILFKRMKFTAYTSCVFSGALIIWLIIQCIMIQIIAVPHIIFFVIGVIQACLSAAILFEQQLFPSNLILAVIKKKKVS